MRRWNGCCNTWKTGALTLSLLASCALCLAGPRINEVGVLRQPAFQNYGPRPGAATAPSAGPAQPWLRDAKWQSITNQTALLDRLMKRESQEGSLLKSLSKPTQEQTDRLRYLESLHKAQLARKEVLLGQQRDIIAAYQLRDLKLTPVTR